MATLAGSAGRSGPRQDSAYDSDSGAPGGVAEPDPGLSGVGGVASPGDVQGQIA